MLWQHMNPRNGNLERGREVMPGIIKLHKSVQKSGEWPTQALRMISEG